MTEKIGKSVKKYLITIFWIINSKVQVRMFFLKYNLEKHLLSKTAKFATLQF